MHLKTYVKITTDQGDYERIGVRYYLEGVSISVEKGFLTYPDERVSLFRIYATDSADPDNVATVWYFIEIKAQASKRGNMSYAAVAAVLYANIPVSQAITTADFANFIERDDRDKNRVLVSTANKLRNVLGRNAHYIGNAADDGVLTFAANPIAISTGQFGQYPLYALCERSIWIMEVGAGDIAFVSIKPVKLHGLLSKNAVMNIDNTVFYLATDGLRTLPPSEQPKSFMIQGSNSENDFLKNVNSDSVLGYFYDEDNGRKEIWVSAINGIYCFSFPMQRWFMLEGVREKFLRVKNKLLGLNEGMLVEENSTENRSGYFITAPIHFGEPEVQKRFAIVILRTSQGDVTLKKGVTAYDVTLSRTLDAGVGVNAIDIEAEVRYSHRRRIKRTEVVRTM